MVWSTFKIPKKLWLWCIILLKVIQLFLFPTCCCDKELISRTQNQSPSVPPWMVLWLEMHINVRDLWKSTFLFLISWLIQFDFLILSHRKAVYRRCCLKEHLLVCFHLAKMLWINLKLEEIRHHHQDFYTLFKDIVITVRKLLNLRKQFSVEQIEIVVVFLTNLK